MTYLSQGGKEVDLRKYLLIQYHAGDKLTQTNPEPDTLSSLNNAPIARSSEEARRPLKLQRLR